MTKIPLAGKTARLICVFVDLVLLAFVAFWLGFAFSWLALVVSVIFLIIAVFYTFFVFYSCVFVDSKNASLTLRGIVSRKDNIEGAKTVFTKEAGSGGGATRVVAVADCEGRELSVIPTLNNANNGYSNEYTAKKLAEALSVDFKATVPPELYDRAAKKEKQKHDEELKREERRLKKEKKRQAKARAMKPAGEEQNAAGNNPSDEQNPPVNYDEMDDLK